MYLFWFVLFVTESPPVRASSTWSFISLSFTLSTSRPWAKIDLGRVQPAWWLRYVATKQKRKHEGKSRERKKLEPVVRCVWVHLAVVVLRAFLIRFYNHTPLLLPLWRCLLQSYFMHVSLKCSFYSRPMCHANGLPTEWLKQPQQEEKDRKSNKNEHRLLHTNMATCFSGTFDENSKHP